MERSAGSELLSMMALVAAVVAAVILVFFGIGYLFGSLFLRQGSGDRRRSRLPPLIPADSQPCH